MILVQPAHGPRAQHLDLACQLVADGAGALDLAPHAGRDLQLRGKGLLQALGRRARGQGLLGKGLEKNQHVLATRESGIGHGGSQRRAEAKRQQRDCRKGLTVE